jgi:2-hydroxychromene-2-carboxylate isomerase
MTNTIEVYYSFQNPYCYLALDEIFEIEKEFEVDLIWQPFSARASGQTAQTAQAVPEKVTYILENARRFAKSQNIPLLLPDSWPEQEFDSNKVTRGALVARDQEVLMEYNYKVFYKIWGLGENPQDDDFINSLCEEIDIDLGEFLNKMSSSETRDRVRNIYKRGKQAGVFETPTLIWNDERYVGLHILDFLKKQLEPLRRVPRK